jgi:hypothetical protein
VKEPEHDVDPPAEKFAGPLLQAHVVEKVEISRGFANDASVVAGSFAAVTALLSVLSGIIGLRQRDKE